MSIDPQTITVAAAAVASVITAIGAATAQIITAIRRHHGPDEPSRRRRIRKTGEDGDG